MHIAVVENTAGTQLKTVAVVSVLAALFISLRPSESFVSCSGPLEGQLLDENQLLRAIDRDLLRCSM